jgi:hypothetical protein
MLKEINTTVAAVILSNLVSLGDDYYLYGEQLTQQGFIAFKATQDRFEAFANNENELKLHRQIRIERSKAKFANPFMASLDALDYKSPYKSEFLERLKREADPDGAVKTLPQAKERMLRLEVDPFVRKWLQLNNPERVKWDNKYHEEFERYRELEIDKFLPIPHKQLRPNNVEAPKLAYEMFENYVKDLGFERKKSMSSNNLKLFGKPLIGDWVLVLTIYSNEWGFDCYRYESQSNGQMRIKPRFAHVICDVRHKKQKGFSSRTHLARIPIDFPGISPLRESAYFAHHDFDGLAVGMLGYIRLYSLMADRIESTLIRLIQEL